MTAKDFCAACPTPAPQVRPASANVRRAPALANAKFAIRRAYWQSLTCAVFEKSPIPRAELPPDPTAKLSMPDTFRRKDPPPAPPAVLPAPTTVARPQATKLLGKPVSRPHFRTERRLLRQSPQSSPPRSEIAAGYRRVAR